MESHVGLPRASLIFIAVLACVSCNDGHLRGTVEQSQDGDTYLVVTEGNNCDHIKIDGVEWPHAIGVTGAIDPGEHAIDCNGEIRFTIPAGSVFKFNYWGP